MVRKMLIALVVAAAGTVAAAAQTKSSSHIPDYAFWLSIDQTNYAYLFPEIDFATNPAAILSYDKKMVIPYAGYAGNKTVTTTTNLPQSTSPGGTQAVTTTSQKPFVSLNGFLPIGTNMVARAMASFSSTSSPGSTVSTNFTAAGTSSTTKTGSQFTPTYDGEGSYGISLGSLDLGLNASYKNTTLQAKNQFTTTSNPAILSGATFYGTGAVGAYGTGQIRTTQTDGILSATGGARYSLGALKAGLGVNYTNETIDQSNGLIAVDETGNGYAQNLVSFSTYETSTQPWGAANTYYANKNTETIVDLNLYPSVTYRINSDFTALVTGFWRPIGTDNTLVYSHTANTDKSQTTTNFNSGMGTFTAIGGVKYTPFSNLELRVGGGYALSSSNYSTDTLSTAGTTTYSTNNPNHYAETGAGGFAGTDPTNGAVIALAVTPTTSVTGTILGVAAVKWDPNPGLSFFADASLSDPTTTNTYNAYDNATNKVWTQVQTSGGLNWQLGAVVGLAVKLSDNLTLATYTSALSKLGVGGTTSSSSTGSPSSGGTTSTNLPGTSTSTKGNTFNAFVDGIVTF